MNGSIIRNLQKYFPLFEAIRTYKKDYVRKDLISALTVAVVAIPQSMAYAIIAGVNPVYGLYTAIVSTIIGSAFGSSSQLNQWLGISIKNSAQMPTMSKLYYVITHLGQTNYYSLLLGLLTIFIIIACKRINKNLPGSLIGIIFSIILVP